MNKKCLLCNNLLSENKFEAKDNLTKVNGTFFYHECSVCGSWNQIPIPSQEFLNQCYAEQELNYKIPQNNLQNDVNIVNKIITRIVSIIDRIVNKLYKVPKKKLDTIDLIPTIPAPAEVLELGAAYGCNLNKLKIMGYKVTGLEPTLESCQKAKESYNLDLINDIIENVTFNDESFDVIIMSMVMEHVKNPRAIIEKCHKWLKKDGELLISIPTSDGFEFKRFKEHCYATHAPYHITIPSLNGVNFLTKDHFVINDFQYQFTGSRDLCYSAYFAREKNNLFNKFLALGYNHDWFQVLVRIYLKICVNCFRLKTLRISIRMRKIL